MLPLRSLSVALAALLLAGCARNESGATGGSEGAGTAGFTEKSAPTSRPDSTSQTERPGVEAPGAGRGSTAAEVAEGAAGSETKRASAAASVSGFRSLSTRVAPDGRLVEEKPPASSSGLAETREGAASESFDNAVTRARKGAGLVAPVDFERLAASIREKYELGQLADPAAELQALLDRFERGDLQAALPIGLFLAYGDASVADPVRAADFFRVASENGEGRALAELGRLHLTGRGANADSSLAQGYFEQAMAAGDPEGAFLLASGHRLELFPNADRAGYKDLLEVAASLGHSAAAKSLFLLAQEGQIDLANYPQMEAWLSASAKSGEASGHWDLYRFYDYTNQPEKSWAAARAAAQSGSVDGLFSLFAQEGLSADNPESRAVMRMALEPHAAADGLAAAEATLFLAYLEALDGDDAAARERVNAAAGAQGAKAQLAQRLADQGVPVGEAIAKVGGMSREDAYEALTKSEADRPDRPPAVLSMKEPPYPVELYAEGLSGRVVLEVEVDGDGAVQSATVVSSDHPAFSDSALEAVADWDFEPAFEGGAPRSSKVRIPLVFAP